MEERGKPLPIETLSRKELEELQSKLLRSTTRKAYEHSLFWHEKFDFLGIKPDDIKNVDDLKKAYTKGLKVTDEDLLFNFPKLCPDYLEEEDYIILTTSGTSKGVWKSIPYTNDDIKRSNEQCRLLFNCVGVKKNSRNLNSFGPPPNASGILCMMGLRAVGASQYPLMVEVPPEIELRIIKSYKPEFIWKIGTKALALGNYLKDVGERGEKLGVKKICIGGEPFSEELKRKIEKLWNANVVDIYASAELSVTGFECPAKNGMHVTENRILLSVKDLESGEESNEGRIVATALYEENEHPGIFLLNKETGDLTKNLGRECECGRTSLKIKPPIRMDDIFSIETKKFYARAVEDILHEDNFTGNYIVIKYTDKDTGQLKKLEIRTEIKKPFSQYKDLIGEVINVFVKSNPLTYEILTKLEKEKKIEITFKSPGELYEGLGQYLRKGKSIRFIEVLV